MDEKNHSKQHAIDVRMMDGKDAKQNNNNINLSFNNSFNTSFATNNNSGTVSPALLKAVAPTKDLAKS